VEVTTPKPRGVFWFAVLLVLLGSIRIYGQPAAQSATPNSPPAFTNLVLDLDGTNSWVELPGKLFTNEVVTVEGWVKWRAFGSDSPFFDFDDASSNIHLSSDASSASTRFTRYRGAAFADHTMNVGPELSLDQWVHLAVVSGTNFSKLYLNGWLFSTNEVSDNWRPYPPVVGRHVTRGTGPAQEHV
jgi:hypothetical protein